MTVIRVDVPAIPARPYEIRIDPGGLDRLGDACAGVHAHRYAVIADSRVAGLYGQRAVNALASAGLDAELFSFPAGEWNKSAEGWMGLCAELLGEGFGRDSARVERSVPCVPRGSIRIPVSLFEKIAWNSAMVRVPLRLRASSASEISAQITALTIDGS